MIRVPGYEGRQVAVFGLGRPGLAAARALARSGAQVLAWDEAESPRRHAAEAGFALRNLAATRWRDIDTLVLSPGISLARSGCHEMAVRAREAGAEIISDANLFLRALGPRSAHRAGLAAITGSSGTSATTALTAHLLSEAGHSVHRGGVRGMPVLDLPEPDADDVIVLALSPFQLGLIETLDADVAAILNIRPGRPHGEQDEAAVRRRIFRNLGAGASAVIGVDDALTEQLCTEFSGNGLAARGVRVEPVSVGKTLGHGVFVLGGVLYEAGPACARRIIDLASLPAFREREDWRTAAAAFACAAPFVQDRAALAQGFASFRSLKRGAGRAAGRRTVPLADPACPARGAA